MKHSWPEGKKFAFTAFDDTDLSTLENVREVYAFLRDLGFRTTKSVWPIRGEGNPTIGGATCEDADYLRWVLELQKNGFEIGYHNSSFHGMPREKIRGALDRFRELFGHDPHAMANHADSAEAIYWGSDRLSGWRRTVYDLATLGRNRRRFSGHLKNSPYFWGDLCHERVRFVRNFVTSDINTLKAFPQMPYRDPAKPWVRYWFGASEGPKIDSFLKTISEANQDRLADEGGACIMYTHFACGFFEHGRLNPEFRRLMTRLAKMDGWFVPLSRLLDHLLEQGAGKSLSAAERAGLERRWLAHKLITRGSS